MIIKATENMHKVKPTHELEIAGYGSHPMVGFRARGTLREFDELFEMEDCAFIRHARACWNAIQKHCGGDPSMVEKLVNLSERELATVLFALRNYQQEHEEALARIDVEDVIVGNGEHFKEHSPLGPEEVDELCERIN